MTSFKKAIKLAVKVAEQKATDEDKRSLALFFAVMSKHTRTAFEKALTRALGVSNRAGCVELRRTRSGRQVGLYKSAEAGIETDPTHPWATVCEDHHGVVCHPTRQIAEIALSQPEEWCPTCQGDPACQDD